MRLNNSVQDLIELIRDVKNTLEHPERHPRLQDVLRQHIDEALRIHSEMAKIQVDEDTLSIPEQLIKDLCELSKRTFGARSITPELRNRLSHLGKRRKKAA